ncbi:MAG: 1-(5-phosphoribosyl)-5-[(5-phosphoribosylamino)methylideneamino] imidazole-4-carboxamide isomerase [Proteobacteria bacterium]|jgi:phosphoribosylformimino-5-aminoimidazole carboxamide ribotide isomerase|nr:1-(5-phosphoribosyl)-5-[(5-phosphoribosylamino)methylideneamino] imidazole-4-carboxamide isomerase [Pseudomonadota bacterium]
MNIKVIPSVDILNGKVVRLFQGKYDKVTEYPQPPVEVVKNFVRHGFDFIHIVNLDGAKGTHNKATENAIEDILQMDCTIQLGGGIRSMEVAEKYISLGAKVVLGTVSAKNPELTEQIIKTFGVKNITLAFDCKEKNGHYEIMVNGWEEGNQATLDEMLKHYAKYEISILCTDISVDGTLTAPNFTLYKWIKKKYPQFFIQASGGISSVEDIVRLKEDAIDGVIVGRAIHHGVISMKELAEI